ncbi:hypothetical protein BLNAU_6815 [Blattamonas nauphoetae]|uniref:Poly(A) RNA polymerase mitochondrial-like central palm domain-containing protein n=1 Tax=Blattamonas nauphoetae TaxID=2049346 RepID=A0ABQ9Y2Y9_9EUKA|nr:hypothetical protein BLNAU_6815 [Blattamonas nauphoetae]
MLRPQNYSFSLTPPNARFNTNMNRNVMNLPPPFQQSMSLPSANKPFSQPKVLPPPPPFPTSQSSVSGSPSPQSFHSPNGLRYTPSQPKQDTSHQPQQFGQYQVNMKSPSPVPKPFSLTSSFSSPKFQAFFSGISSALFTSKVKNSLTDHDYNRRKHVVRFLEGYIQNKAKDQLKTDPSNSDLHSLTSLSLFIFGSSLTHLGSKRCDLDIYCKCGIEDIRKPAQERKIIRSGKNVQYITVDTQIPMSVSELRPIIDRRLRTISQLLSELYETTHQNLNDDTAEAIQLLSGRIPILRLHPAQLFKKAVFTTTTKADNQKTIALLESDWKDITTVDINVSSADGLHSSLAIEKTASEVGKWETSGVGSTIQILLFMTKLWLKERHISDAYLGFPSSYNICILALHWLKIWRCSVEDIINSMRLNDPQQKPNTPSNQPLRIPTFVSGRSCELGLLMYGFFLFYGHFYDYEKRGPRKTADGRGIENDSVVYTAQQPLSVAEYTLQTRMTDSGNDWVGQIDMVSIDNGTPLKSIVGTPAYLFMMECRDAERMIRQEFVACLGDTLFQVEGITPPVLKSLGGSTLSKNDAQTMMSFVMSFGRSVIENVVIHVDEETDAKDEKTADKSQILTRTENLVSRLISREIDIGVTAFITETTRMRKEGKEKRRNDAQASSSPFGSSPVPTPTSMLTPSPPSPLSKLTLPPSPFNKSLSASQSLGALTPGQSTAWNSSSQPALKQTQPVIAANSFIQPAPSTSLPNLLTSIPTPLRPDKMKSMSSSQTEKQNEMTKDEVDWTKVMEQPQTATTIVPVIAKAKRPEPEPITDPTEGKQNSSSDGRLSKKDNLWLDKPDSTIPPKPEGASNILLSDEFISLQMSEDSPGEEERTKGGKTKKDNSAASKGHSAAVQNLFSRTQAVPSPPSSSNPPSNVPNKIHLRFDDDVEVKEEADKPVKGELEKWKEKKDMLKLQKQHRRAHRIEEKREKKLQNKLKQQQASQKKKIEMTTLPNHTPIVPFTLPPPSSFPTQQPPLFAVTNQKGAQQPSLSPVTHQNGTQQPSIFAVTHQNGAQQPSLFAVTHQNGAQPSFGGSEGVGEWMRKERSVESLHAEIDELRAKQAELERVVKTLSYEVFLMRSDSKKKEK